ncbi:MAG: non-heme ferritin [Planctomycetota bacterium]|nr:non-heme ferritin [Planctomycetota bacterium]
MLSDSLTKRLNRQITLEQYSANLYLQMSAWCEAQGLVGCAHFLGSHAEEEVQHMRRLFRYVNDTGAMAVIGAVDAPRADYADVKDLFEATLAHEEGITAAINELVAAAFAEGDYSTFQFLQWYVAEQHEEEGLFKQICDRIRIVGVDGPGLFLFDREIGDRVGASSKATPAN